MRGFLALLLLLPAAAFAHPKGFHKKVLLTVEGGRAAALVVMDVDDSERAELLRATADSDRNGVLSRDETAKLRAKLVELATSKLRVSVSGHRLSLPVKDVRLSLRQEKRVGESGMSVAVMLESELPGKIVSGMVMVVEDTSPDGSPVQVELGQTDAGVVSREILAGEKIDLRLTN